MTFGEALQALQDNKRVTRTKWSDESTRIALHRGGVSSGLTSSQILEPYIYVSHPLLGGMVPWTPSQDDMLASDWVLA